MNDNHISELKALVELYGDLPRILRDRLQWVEMGDDYDVGYAAGLEEAIQFIEDHYDLFKELLHRAEWESRIDRSPTPVSPGQLPLL